MSSSTELDNRVRLHLYEGFVADRRPPGVDETAVALGLTPGEVADALRRLEAGHVIVLAPGTLNVWMANPLSAVPTAFRVETERGGHWGNCIWDALGVVAMLGDGGSVHTLCRDCQEPMTIRVEERELAQADGFAHFSVPARRWWDNIGFT